MKGMVRMVLCILALAGTAHAKELSVARVLSDGDVYAGKAVSVEGDFLYSEPGRESFTIGQNSSTIEVFYRDLPGKDKLYLLSQPKYSKTAILVSGTLRQYANREHSYFIDAAAIRYEGAASPSPAQPAAVSYADIQYDPAKYVNKPVMMKGTFLYTEPLRQSFVFEQNSKTVEVIFSDLSKIDRDRILAQKNNSKISVTVSGLLQNYANEGKRFFITAYAVTLGD